MNWGCSSAVVLAWGKEGGERRRGKMGRGRRGKKGEGERKGEEKREGEGKGRGRRGEKHID